MYFSTASCTADDKNRVWAETLSETYFPLVAECHDNATFRGELRSWSLGILGLSDMACDGVLYHRRRRDFVDETESSLLITIPHEGAVNFTQGTREATCLPGAFLVERGDVPYRFWHAKRNKLWVLKVPTASMRSRLGATDRLGALTFDAMTGIGSYFVGAVRNTIANIDQIDQPARDLAGQQLLDLLCLAVRSDDRILDSKVSTIRAAHLQRAEQMIRDNLGNARLSSQMVAESCGISLRYLQQLFSENDQSVTGYIREQRLIRCDEALRSDNSGASVASIALDWGFYDQAQFSKHYRKRFGRTPSDTRRHSRAGGAVR